MLWQKMVPHILHSPLETGKFPEHFLNGFLVLSQMRRVARPLKLHAKTNAFKTELDVQIFLA